MKHTCCQEWITDFSWSVKDRNFVTDLGGKNSVYLQEIMFIAKVNRIFSTHFTSLAKAPKLTGPRTASYSLYGVKFILIPSPYLLSIPKNTKIHSTCCVPVVFLRVYQMEISLSTLFSIHGSSYLSFYRREEPSF